MAEQETAWLPFSPRFKDELTTTTWTDWAKVLVETKDLKARRRRPLVATLLEQALSLAPTLAPGDRVRFEAAARVACDLTRQGWKLQIEEGILQFSVPEKLDEVMEEKARVRAQLHLGRDEQLRGVAPQKFIRRMETRRVHGGEWVSIFSVMRDGRELAAALREANERQDPSIRLKALGDTIQPYFQEVRGRVRCQHTGLVLRDIWRYFRHTWASAYRSTPGRNLDLIIRDAAAPYHPVIGIASIISSAAQIRIRDEWIGWAPKEVLRSIIEDPQHEWAMWLRQTWEQSWEEIYDLDFLEEGLFTRADTRQPTRALIKRLRAFSAQKRHEHERFAKGSHHKGKLPLTEDGEPDWELRARTPLYKSKRALRISDLLRARLVLDKHLTPPTAVGLQHMVTTGEGRWVVRHLARRAKADKMGVAIADLGVCGAVAPYTHLLGGKLISMLMMSPEIRSIYDKKYRETQSVIASSSAGHPITRGTDLVLLMTTSLYGAGSSQYNRIRLPCAKVGGSASQTITYASLGLTAGYGTSQFADETVEALARVTSQETEGQRINSFFGEGTNPRLRKVREGLDRLKLDSGAILIHGSPKVVYTIPLAANLRRFLLGLDQDPDYLLAQDRPEDRTDEISAWWRERWLAMRSAKEEILQRVERESPTEPVRHGARVRCPKPVRGDSQIERLARRSRPR